MQRLLEVVDYDPNWPRLFAAEAKRLNRVFGTALVEIHHIGSTSIPHLAAKPTIDIAVELTSDTIIPEYYPQMESLDFVCRGECLDAPVPGVPGRFYFVRCDGPQHLVHVHAYRTGHNDLTEKLSFRDYLRSNQQRVLEYGELKKALVIKDQHDNIAYMRGKDEMVKAILKAAETGS